MIVFKMEEFAGEGMFREEDFRQRFENHDWNRYENQIVLISGCDSGVFIPQWAWLAAGIQLSQYAKRITFGEPRTQIPVFQRQPENTGGVKS